MKAVVTAEWTVAGDERLRALGYDVVRGGWGLPRAELLALAQGSALLVVELETVDAALLDALPSVRTVATCRGTPINVDLAAAQARGVRVLHTPGRNAASVADSTIGLMLALLRGISAAERHLRARTDGGWDVDGRLPYEVWRGRELGRITVGVVGAGAVGREVVRRLEGGFGSRVLVADPAVAGAASLPDLLAASDVVTLHTPPVPVLGAAELALLPAGAYVVNTARAVCCDTEALCDELDSGRLAGAALDVFDTEPLPGDARVRRTPGLLLTPHLAGAALDVVTTHTAMVCTDLERLSRGEAPLHEARVSAGGR